MIVEASVLIAIVRKELGCERLVDTIIRSSATGIGAPTLAEAAIVLRPRNTPPGVLPALLKRTGVHVVAFTEAHADAASDAYARLGRGRRPAALDFGDCMAYAVARLAPAPLLFVGDDFSHTDIVAAL